VRSDDLFLILAQDRSAQLAEALFGVLLLCGFLNVENVVHVVKVA
jgi:hypothetical protein